MERYFRLELAGAVESVPDWEREPCIFVMNHTAILGLEVYLLNAALRRLRPQAPPPCTTVWPTFLRMPILGGFYLQPTRDTAVVPFGWAGVDEANPWRVVTNPVLVRLLMKPLMPRFDFALLPKPPMLRPSKVVFVAGEPLRFTPTDLADERGIRHQVARVREIVVGLVAEAAALRRRRIEDSVAERLLHRVTRTDHVAWERRDRAGP